MIYLSGHINSLRHPRLGFMLSLNMWNAIPKDVFVAADNGCYGKEAINYSEERYMAHLKDFPRRRTLFASAPDVYGDHAKTVTRSIPGLRMIRSYGIRAAFVAQDGWEEATTPWDECDAIFVGGTTEFKFRGGRDAVRAAKQRGKWAHMGRVNSLERLRAALSIGCDSADGTYLCFGPDTNSPKLLRWLQSLDDQIEMVF